MKRSLVVPSLVILMAFTLGCLDRQTFEELEEMKAQAEVEEQNKALMRRSFEEWNKGSAEFFLESTSPDYVCFSPSGNPDPASREETVESIEAIWRGFPDLTLSIDDLLAVEDKVVVRYTMRGTHTGELQGIPATGKKIEVGGIVTSRIRDGKFVEEWEAVDTFGLMMQLGMELRPASVEE
jgi:steroid delta-isomerase-like uncharacterized protein